MFRRRQRPKQPNESNIFILTSNPPSHPYNRRNPLQKKYIHLCIIILSIDLLLTITRQTYPHSSLPLLQRLVHTPGKDGTFAQNYQDTWIVKLTRTSPQLSTSTSSSTPFFLDIGAYHGLWCSNSYLLEQQYNWRGACVEPFPDGFQQRSCELFVNAMSDTDGVEVDFSGVGQERTIGSTSDSDTSKHTRGKLMANTISFPTLLKQSKAPSFIAFISLDVEGHEYTALTKFPWDDYTVGAWIIEGHDAQVKKLLESHGYMQRPVKNRGADEYFVRDEYWSEVMVEKEWRVHPLFSWGC